MESEVEAAAVIDDRPSEADLERYIADGLDGIEILHPANGPSVRATLGRVVRKAELLRSGGSDWHGPGAGGGEPGSQRVPESWMRTIEQRTAVRD